MSHDRKSSGRPHHDGYNGIRRRKFILPPNCKLLDIGLDRRLRNRLLPSKGEGLGVKILTDPYGNPVVKEAHNLRPGEVCYIVR